MIRILSLCFFCLVLSVVPGCFRATGEVQFHGKVTVDGVPADMGVIEFEPVNRDTASGGGVIGKGGVYTAKVMPGEKIVRIKANKILKEYDAPDGTHIVDQESLIPEEKSWNKSELHETITTKTKELNFDLKSN